MLRFFPFQFIPIYQNSNISFHANVGLGNTDTPQEETARAIFSRVFIQQACRDVRNKLRISCGHAPGCGFGKHKPLSPLSPEVVPMFWLDPPPQLCCSLPGGGVQRPPGGDGQYLASASDATPQGGAPCPLRLALAPSCTPGAGASGRSRRCYAGRRWRCSASRGAPACLDRDAPCQPASPPPTRAAGESNPAPCQNAAVHHPPPHNSVTLL